MNFVSVLNEFQELGCNELAKCAVACRVYLDLMLDKRFSSIDKCYENSLDVLFLKAERLDHTPIIVLPSLSNQQLDFNTINKLQNQWRHDEKVGGSLLLAICDTSSNILYYQLNQGFEDKHT